MASDYRYVDGAYVDVLLDGSSLVGKGFKPGRTADSFKGLAVEKLTIPLSIDQFDSLAAASRVDIVVNWFTKFTLGTRVKSSLRNFVRKVEPLAEAAKSRSVEEADKRRELEAQNSAEEKERNTCRLTFDQAPKIRGFRLGMTTNELFSNIPQSLFEKQNSMNALIDQFRADKAVAWFPDSLGGGSRSDQNNLNCRVNTYAVSFNRSGAESQRSGSISDPVLLEKFDGVSQLWFLIVNDAVIGYAIRYTKPRQLGLRDSAFVEALTANSILPKTWVGTRLADFASCSGFYVDVTGYRWTVAVVMRQGSILSPMRALRSTGKEINRNRSSHNQSRGTLVTS